MMLIPSPPWLIPLRKRCIHCGATEGRIEKRSDQNCVYCAECGHYAGYNAPKSETGEPQRHVADRDGIKPSQKARLKERALYRCEPCGATERDGHILHIAHFLSVKAGHDLGVSDDELSSDENLYVSCEACNLGQGAFTISPRLMLNILRARWAERRARERMT